MFVSHNRDRLINAMIYFAGGTRIDNKSKLFRLLYLLDFAHFRRTGISVTGSDYSADHLGPVPIEVDRAWNDPASPLRQTIQFVKEVGRRHSIPDRTASRAFDESHFTPRQLRILSDLADRYRDARHPDLTEVSEEDNAAYARSWRDGEGEHQPIPYDLAISDTDPHANEIREAAREARLLEQKTHPARGESA
ncbi:Panacea domain-containing protein [Paraburkholderia bannensis]|uniref:Panacea domain-containing protein n=1 Tax=Paraburkholderia bannensis TaxID=765414 RepID=UPI002AB601D5|nr:Panacea domain-containing protein [Paraburkholderia bannensis]